MYDRLNWLMSCNLEGQRANTVQEVAKQGKKLIGVIGSYVPEEVIWASGMVPIRIAGTWQENVAQAEVYRPANTDVCCTHILQAILQGDWDMLDGVVFTYYDDDVRRLWDVLVHRKWKAFLYMLYVPYKSDERCRQMFRHALEKLAKALGNLNGVEIDSDAFWNAIAVYNRWRTVLYELYELRKREHPPLSGAEYLKLTTASFVLPKDKYTDELKGLMPYLATKANENRGPRILVSSDGLSHPGYLQLVEDTGALVAMDDLDTGSRYFWTLVDSRTDPLAALAERYLLRPPDPRSFEWERHLRQIEEWVRDFRIEGVINLIHRYGQWRQVEVPYFRDTLAKAGIPSIAFECEYHLANVGQLRTRIGAFMEMLSETEEEL